MSFFLTTRQFQERTKTVTRRLGWENLKPGEIVMGVVKCQGLGKGGKVQRLGPIRIASVRREQLKEMTGKLTPCLKAGESHPQTPALLIWKAKLRVEHPDVGGSATVATKLNAAMADIRKRRAS